LDKWKIIAEDGNIPWPSGETGKALEESLSGNVDDLLLSYGNISSPSGTDSLIDLRTSLFFMVSYALDMFSADHKSFFRHTAAHMFNNPENGGAFFFGYCMDMRSFKTFSENMRAAPSDEERSKLADRLRTIYVVPLWLRAFVLFAHISAAQSVERFPIIERIWLSAANTISRKPWSTFIDLDMAIRGATLYSEIFISEKFQISTMACASRNKTIRHSIRYSPTFTEDELESSRARNLNLSICRLARQIQTENKSAKADDGDVDPNLIATPAEMRLADMFLTFKQIGSVYLAKNASPGTQKATVAKTIPEVFARVLVGCTSTAAAAKKAKEYLVTIDEAAAYAFFYCQGANLWHSEDWWSCTEGIRCCKTFLESARAEAKEGVRLQE
jgi:hypothetical protein